MKRPYSPIADDVWVKPRTLNAKGWEINGCPTDWPTLCAEDSNVAIAWFTRSGDEAKVQLALSSDKDQIFRRPVLIDSGNPLSRPAIAAFVESCNLVTWLEKTANGNPEIDIRRISFHGVLSDPHTVLQAPLARASGLPKVVVSGDRVFLAWRDERVRAMLLKKSEVIESQMKDKK